MRSFSGIVVIGAALMLAACDDDNRRNPNTPTPQSINVSGTWAGDVTVLGTPARMSWALSQTGTTVTGPVLVSLPTGTVLMNATLAGTLNASTIAYTMTVNPGGIPLQPGCSGQLGGSVTLSAAVTSLTGSYAVLSTTCPNALTAGTFTLTRQ